MFCATAYLLVCQISAQNPTTQPTPLPSEQDEVVRITTNLIQVDAVVIDKEGNQITNLTADDFEVFQDGKAQKIANFSYINTNKTAGITGDKKDKNTPPQTPVPISRPGGYGRIVTFIVDDGSCTSSQIGITASREGLEKFVNEQMQSNDLVAIYQTRAGSSLIQQYTSDKTQLRRIIGKINWTSASACDGRGGDLFEREKADYTLKASGGGKKTFESPADREQREAFEDSIRDAQTVGSIEVLRSIVRRLKDVGGRKIIFFLSDGLTVVGRNNRTFRAQDVLRTLIAEANQSSIVFNSIDIRGQFNASLLQANDEVLPEMPNVANPTSTDKALINRTNESRNSQDGLKILADETGGSFSQGKNLLDTSIRDLMNLEKGYYLLTYQPDEETFKGKKYHKIEIKLKRSDWRILSRSSFSATNIGEETKPKKRTESSEIFDALNAPLPRTGLNVRLNAFFGNTLFGNTIKEGSFVYSIMRLNGRDISFVDDTSGYKKAVLDVTVVLLDEKNKVAGSINRTHTIRVSPQEITVIQEKGLTYPVYLTVKEAGIYSLRVAVQDAASRQIGSASQTVEVPNLKKGNLFLSVVTLAEVDKKGNSISPMSIKSENGTTVVESIIPRFRRGGIIAYVYTLYNAQVDKTSNQPRLNVQVSLYQNGKIVFEEKPQSPPLEAKTDWTRTDSGGYLQLNPNVQSGEYSLQVRIKDLLSGKTVEQWIDFELID